MAQVLFINPSWQGLVSSRGGRHNRPWPPLDLLGCAALARQSGLSVDLADARAVSMGIEELRRRAAQAQWVVISSSPLDRWQCPNLELDLFIQTARALEHPHLVITGVHGSLYPQRLLEQTGAYALVIGEPEQTAAELLAGGERSQVPGLAYLEDGKLIANQPRPLLDLNSLPLPAFDLAPPKRYSYEALGGDLALLETSRGCPHNCSFCLKTMYGPGIRFKDPAQAAREAQLAASLGARHAYIFDLDFTARRSHTLEVCRHLQMADTGLIWCCQARADGVDQELLAAMHQAGCRLIHFGVESASTIVLDKADKRLAPQTVLRAVETAEQLGIATACFFMFGLPGETPRDRKATIKLAQQLKAAYCSFHPATAYPGTRLFEEQPAGDPFALENEAQIDPQIKADIRKAYLAFYLRPGRMLRVLKRGGPMLWQRGLRLLIGFLR